VSTFDRIEAGMPRLLTELADPRMPDYFDTVVRRTAGSNQRPGWTFPERWIPMSVLTVASRRRAVPWMAVVLAVALIALVAGAILIGSSRLPRSLPPPFGPAGAGLVIYETGGDIVGVDPATGTTTTLVGGRAIDSAPRWSPDGSRFVFRRMEGGGRETVFVAGADGTGVTPVSSGPAGALSDYLFSPDGRHLLMTSASDGEQSIQIIDLADRSTRELRDDDSVSLPTFRPPTGSEFLFVTGIRWSPHGQGLATYDMASGAVRTIVEPIPGAEIVGRPEYSPDGNHLAFAVWIPATNTNSHIIVADADGSDQRRLPQPAGLCCEAAPTWSNDGTRLALTRWYDPMREVVAVVPWAVGGVGQEFDVPRLYRGLISWSPDDDWLLVTPQLDEHGVDREPQIVLDLATGRARDIGWTTTSDPSIQRLPR
jgi:Tol biopolymer transport system component